MLSREERERAERFARVEDRRRWSRSRGVLRALLGNYAGADPKSLRFSIGVHGKPSLAVGPMGLCFNLSHSGNIAIYAFALECAVGIDVELSGQEIDMLAVAARAFEPEVVHRLRTLDPQALEREFLSAWVRREALLKCRGIGFGIAGGGATDESSFWVTELDVGVGAAALAIEGQPREVRCWAW
jgi:4'-phosphopantetheinyl transferase